MIGDQFIFPDPRELDRLIDSFQNSSYNGSSKLFPSLANGGSSHNGSPDMRNNMNNRRFDHHLPTI